jgi:hypothetical protein
VAKRSVTVFAVLITLGLLSTQAMAQVSGGSLPDLKTPFIGRPLTCSQPEPEKLTISEPFAERAKLKVRLLNLLRESLHDDAHGIVDIAREKEIRKLANKLKKDRNEMPD